MKFERNIFRLQQGPREEVRSLSHPSGLVVLSYPEASQGPLGEEGGTQAVGLVSSAGHRQDTILP